MSSTTRNLSEPDSPGKSSASARANPVCLELGVTLRSLPGQANSPTHPIREELKTVIVFENGAVLRSANDLQAGLSVILSNANGRDVVCRVVTGRSMPSVKGYVEVEFLEPVKDFWGIHQDSTPAPAPPVPVSKPGGPTVSSAARTEIPKPAAVRSAPASIPQPIEASEALSGTPEFDEFPTPLSNLSVPASSPKAEPKPPIPSGPDWGSGNKGASIPEKPVREYSHSDSAAPTSVANWTPPEPEPPAAKQPLATSREPVSAISSGPVQTRDFMSQGLMAYDKPDDSGNASGGKNPLILAAAAVVLVGVCGAAFFLSRGSGNSPAAKVTAANVSAISQPSTTSDAPAPVRQQTAQQPLPPAPRSEAQPQAQTVAAEPVQPSEAVAPIPVAEITNAANSDTRTDSRARRQEKTAAPKQAEAASPKRPKIADLKMSAPAAPNKNLADTSEAAPIAEVASPNLPAGSTPAALLSSSGRTAGQPTPPAAPAPPPMKVVTDPKLISSAGAVYPQSARQANVEGSVTVMAYIDQTGKVFSARAINGPVMLRAAAEEAVKQWKYSPGLEDGKPVQSHTMVKVDFKLH